MDVNLQERYRRQLILPDVGQEGQSRLSQAKVAVVGAGGLGSPIIYYLAAAGVGELLLIDDDKISLSNLQRQILYQTDQLGNDKVHEARKRVEALNPHIKVEVCTERLQSDNITSWLDGYDLVVEATDNYASRLLIERYTRQAVKAWISGSVEGWIGQVTYFPADRSLGYDDLYPEYQASDDAHEVGVVGSVAGVIGAMEATEAIKQIVGVGCSEGYLLSVNLLTMEVERFAF